MCKFRLIFVLAVLSSLLAVTARCETAAELRVENTTYLAADDSSGHRSGLPLLASRLEKFGYKAPLPFGASIGVMFAAQHFIMDNIRIDGEDVEVFSISSARGINTMVMPKLDMWLLPFLDLYAFGGYMTGVMNVDVTVYDIPLLGDRRIPLEFDFTGGMLGGGMTLVGGYSFIFAMLDGNYSKASLSSFESHLDMYMASARLGVTTGSEGSQAMFWLGGMYQNLDQTLQESFQLSEQGSASLVEIDVGVKEAWNMVAGSRLHAGRRLSILVEAGFIGRRQLFANIEYRF